MSPLLYRGSRPEGPPTAQTRCCHAPRFYGRCPSVHLDRREDLPDEPVAGVEADGACGHEEDEGSDGHVAEVEEARDELCDLELCEEVEDGVGEHVARGGAGGEEGAPPPVVVLGAQLEVAHDDGDLGAGDDEDDEDQHEEAEDVVVLGEPDGGEGKG